MVRDLIDPCSLRSMMPHSSARRGDVAGGAGQGDDQGRPGDFDLRR